MDKKTKKLHDEETNDIVDNGESEGTVEEMHDRENAEKKSYDSVAATDDGVKKAPKRRGDKENGMKSELKPAPKTKTGVIHDMYQKLEAMSKEELLNVYETVMSDEFGAEVEDVAEEVVVEDVEIDVDGELAVMIEEEATLSEEFKSKAGVLFNTALNAKLKEEVERVEANYAEINEERNKELVEQVDGYLNYVVEQFVEDNKVAIEAGIRTQVAENFMEGLKNLFVESYIEVPESKVDLVDELAEQVEELEERLNTATAKAIKLSEANEDLLREKIIAECADDLADTQVEKLAGLVEDIDFEDAETFRGKVETVKESYFKKDKSAKVEDFSEESTGDTEEVISEEVTGPMAAYLAAQKRISKKQ